MSSLQPPEVEHESVMAAGVRLHVARAGPADGPLIVFLHGFPEFWYAWRHQLPFFAAHGFLAVAPDQRGYNLSDKPRKVASYRLDRLADDVASLIVGYRRQEATIIGHDWGAAVAWWTALRHPNRVGALAILNGPHPVIMRKYLGESWSQFLRSWYVAAVQPPWLPERLLSLNDHGILVHALRSSAEPRAFLKSDIACYRRSWSVPGSVNAMLNWYRAVARWPPPASTDQRVSSPALILWGAEDRFLEKEMIHPTLEACEDGRAEILANVSHWIHLAEPDLVNRRLLTFLNDLGTRLNRARAAPAGSLR